VVKVAAGQHGNPLARLKLNEADAAAVRLPIPSGRARQRAAGRRNVGLPRQQRAHRGGAAAGVGRGAAARGATAGAQRAAASEAGAECAEGEGDEGGCRDRYDDYHYLRGREGMVGGD
jgi:hypothetical protein